MFGETFEAAAKISSSLINSANNDSSVNESLPALIKCVDTEIWDYSVETKDVYLFTDRLK